MSSETKEDYATCDNNTFEIFNKQNFDEYVAKVIGSEEDTVLTDFNSEFVSDDDSDSDLESDSESEFILVSNPYSGFDFVPDFNNDFANFIKNILIIGLINYSDEDLIYIFESLYKRGYSIFNNCIDIESVKLLLSNRKK
jgi:hypothetical protein